MANREKANDNAIIVPNITTTPSPSRTFAPRKPHCGQIHARSLPVTVHPLPAFIAHNPLSIIRIAYTLLSHYLRPPPSHVITKAYFSSETRSVHVTEPQAISALWTQGFFGKGALSRSEPQRLELETRKRGLQAAETSTEVTQRRRAERREFKQERALKEREAIEEELRKSGEVAHAVNELETGDVVTVLGASECHTSSADGAVGNTVDVANLAHTPSNGEAVRSNSTTTAGLAGTNQASFSTAPHGSTKTASLQLQLFPNDEGEPLVNQEHLQLSLEEAFFLTYALGVLEITTSPDYGTPSTISVPKLFQLCRTHSYFPPVSPAALRPDDPFVLSYVTYHHFRSLGWVVRPGIKFAVDFLLYHRGPAFSHAEFAVLILPSYSDPYWRSTPERRAEVAKREKKEWWWFSCMSRVQTQVLKTLVLVYIDIPQPLLGERQEQEVNDIGAYLKRYRVREFICKRWVPNRHRD